MLLRRCIVTGTQIDCRNLTFFPVCGEANPFTCFFFHVEDILEKFIPNSKWYKWYTPKIDDVGSY